MLMVEKERDPWEVQEVRFIVLFWEGLDALDSVAGHEQFRELTLQLVNISV
jgi:hypothetical protein